MHDHYRTTALELVLDVLPEIKRVLRPIQREDSNLAKQLRASASSVALNLGEADGSDPGTSKARLHSAMGSLNETRTALKVAAAWEYIAHEDAEKIEAVLDRVAAMTWRRIHSRR